MIPQRDADPGVGETEGKIVAVAADDPQYEPYGPSGPLPPHVIAETKELKR